MSAPSNGTEYGLVIRARVDGGEAHATIDVSGKDAVTSFRINTLEVRKDSRIGGSGLRERLQLLNYETPMTEDNCYPPGMEQHSNRVDGEVRTPYW